MRNLPVREFIACLSLLSLLACSDMEGSSSRVGLLNGERVSLQPESILLLNYWAEWCKPCAEEIPELNVFSQRSGYKVLGINFDALRQPLAIPELQRQRDKLRIGFGVLEPASALLLERQWQLPRPQGLPVTYIMKQKQHADGRYQAYLVAQLSGPQTVASLQAAVSQHVKSPLAERAVKP